ncbi:hypothetical protein PENANT_c013G09157 [Penicillium antarcticum]|uniref:HpcH/HpaI aldolase/citrate lyase domain-containing protein n=1 Tax=Penicillium antarcticum TaxID=416450 RepID=A0A1V6Q5A0_9EURO|nr:hypothetical protein PENANT_c013G09157 [Penicillium antarcticum]
MAGFHGMFIDMEHSTLDLHSVGQLILACNYVGISAVVRAPSKSHWHISRILDAGAAAVVIPHVENVQEVKDLVRCAKYAPLGARHCTNNQPVLEFATVPIAVQNRILNVGTMLIPMIETPGAVELAEDILGIEGVDGVLVRSNDPCADLGSPGLYDDERHLESVVRVLEAGRKVGKPCATWSLSGADGAILQSGMKQITKNYADVSRKLQKVKN